MITLDFLVTALIVVLIPGTGVVFTVSTALVHGKRASAFAALGCTAGIVPHLVATIVGLAAILHTSAMAFQALKFAGVAYLCYLAWTTWRDTAAFHADSAPTAKTGGRLVLKALLINVLNPKLSIFFLAFLPQFVSPATVTPLRDLFALSAVFMAMTFVVFVIYGWLADGFRKAVLESPRVQNVLRRTFAGAFAGLGLNLALAER